MDKKLKVSKFLIIGYKKSGKIKFVETHLKNFVLLDLREVNNIFKSKNRSFTSRILRYVIAAINSKIGLAVIAANNTRSHRLKLLEMMGRKNVGLIYVRRSQTDFANGKLETLHEPLPDEGFADIVSVTNDNGKFNLE